jgi:DNA (cytosine-5)-methyltransferase 1
LTKFLHTREEKVENMPYRVGSLFAGVGGICLGFHQAIHNNSSYELVWANEIDEYAAITYEQNFNHELIVGDIEKIVKLERCENDQQRTEYEEKKERILNQRIDILTGGFPCQAFSIAGNRRGFDDHRGNLFYSIIDLVNLLNERQEKPRVLFLENVKNLRGHDNGNTFQVIKTELENIGYTVKEAVLNTMSYTEMPQNRERIFIVCFLNIEDAARFTMFDVDDRGRYINLNNFRVQITEEQRIQGLQELINWGIGRNQIEYQGYYYTRERYPKYFTTEEEFLQIPEQERNQERINLDEQITEPFQFYQIRRGMYVRMNMSGVCPTLTANMGTGGHNVPLIRVADGIRKLTPEETFKLQGFPIGNGYELPETFNGRRYSDGRLYKQAGNAVSVPVIKLIAEQILIALDGE